MVIGQNGRLGATVLQGGRGTEWGTEPREWGLVPGAWNPKASKLGAQDPSKSDPQRTSKVEKLSSATGLLFSIPFTKIAQNLPETNSNSGPKAGRKQNSDSLRRRQSNCWLTTGCLGGQPGGTKSGCWRPNSDPYLPPSLLMEPLE